jgi:putative DNA primase/helicase
LAVLPAELLALVAGDAPGGNGNGRPKRPLEEPILEGTRNATLTSVAGTLRHRGMDQATILATIAEVNARRCVPPLPEPEVRGIAASVARYEPEGSGKGKRRRFRLTDLGNAERLIHQHGEDLRYCHAWKSWLVWDGRKWARDATAEVERRAVRTVRSMYAEAARVDDTEKRGRLVSHAKRSESARGIQAMVSLAASLVPIQPEGLNLDPWLLNVRNGMLDLRTGKLCEHDRNALITKLAPVDYDPEATHPAWERVLERLTPELREYLQLAYGATLTGDTSGDVLFFILGDTKAGKSSLTGGLKAALGDYATTANFASFLKQSREDGSGHRTDLANLAGARMVLSLEVEKGRRLAQALLKHLTGGDTIRVRKAYQDEFEYRPQFKLWLVANDKPQANSDDAGFWERMRLIPFPESLPPAGRDKSVREALFKDPGAHAAILAWGVKGCLEWQRRGRELPIPDVVREATAGYREESDELAGFFEDRCEFCPEARTTSANLKHAYHEWCQENHERTPLRWNDFTERLKKRGCKVWSDGQRRGWSGIRLRPESDLLTDI